MVVKYFISAEQPDFIFTELLFQLIILLHLVEHEVTEQKSEVFLLMALRIGDEALDFIGFKWAG